MSTQNEEDSNSLHPSSGAFVAHRAFDLEETLEGRATVDGSAEEVGRSDGATQGFNGEPPKLPVSGGKSPRAGARKGRVETQATALGPATPAAKPARVKRTRTQSVRELKDQAEAVSKPKRTSTKKTTSVVDAPAVTATASSGIPPITLAAIEFLGKQDATATDLLKLGPDSLAFVRYHFKYVQQLEADSLLSNAYLVANMPPANPAIRYFADALAKHGNREHGYAVVQTPVDVPEPETRQAEKIVIPSYGQKAATVPTYVPVAVQLRKLELNSGRAVVQTETSEFTLDGHKREQGVFGTAHILKSPPIKDLTQREVADRVAGEAEEVRTMKDVAVRHMRLNAKAAAVGSVFEVLENVIEWRPFQRLLGAGPGASAPRAAAGEQFTARKGVEQSAAFAGPGEKVAPDPAPRRSARWRPRLLLGSVADWTTSWLSGQASESPAPAAHTQVFLDESATLPEPVVDKSAVVPESVARRFLKVEHEYYFQDRTLAFSDRGNKLATRGTDPEVVRSLVEIAKARGWDAINVEGAEDFRRSAWMEAAQYGLIVAGYKPTALDLAELANRPANNVVEKGVVHEKSNVPKQPTTQRPAAHGTEAQPAAAAPAVPKKSVLDARQSDSELAVKAKAFQENEPSFVVKQYPDLAAAYGIVAAAETFATEKLPEAAREEFVALARRHVVEKIMAGTQIQGPKIYMASTKTVDINDRTTTADATVDSVKFDRAKGIETER